MVRFMDEAKEQGWKGADKLNFGDTFSASGRANDTDRQYQGNKLLRQCSNSGGVGAKEMMSILRNERAGICMGRGGGFTSTGSQVSILPLDPSVQCVHFFTGTPDPSVSGFKPFLFNGKDTEGSSSVVSPVFSPNEDPAKKKPRFESSVDRSHDLWKSHDKEFFKTQYISHNWNKAVVSSNLC